MIRAARHRSLFLMLGLAALLGQLLLPSLHAQTQLRRGADPLLLAFCGEVAPARLAALRAQLGAQPRRHGDTGTAAALLPGCPLCAGPQAAALPSPDRRDALAPGAAPQLVRRAAGTVARAARLRRPPPRGPPHRA